MPAAYAATPLDPRSHPTASPFVSAWLADLNYAWGAMTEGTRTVTLKKDQVLFHQGQLTQAVYVIEEGRVRLSSFSLDGRERHLMILGSHGLVGDCGWPHSDRYTVSALASSEARLRVVDMQRFVAALSEQPLLTQQHRELNSRRLCVLLQQLELQAHNSAGRRICHHLLGLLYAYGSPVPQGRRIGISFTQQEMGNICGLSRVSVAYVFSRLERQGVIARQQRHLIVLRPEQLEREAGGLGEA
jgi:CRP/FNR family transcriptional regulator, cyclic AMP receptor protein